MGDTTALTWVSESAALPLVAQSVLLMTPRRAGEFWNINIACILIRYEGVLPRPVEAGAAWPVDYWWGTGPAREIVMVTGNGWWAPLSSLPLPPGAEHRSERGYDYIAQIGEVFVQRAAGRSV